jgi:hypothetical protein
VLVIFGIGALIACRPRNGKTVWFAENAFLSSAVAVLIVSGFAIGLILLASHFTTIDDATLRGIRS